MIDEPGHEQAPVAPPSAARSADPALILCAVATLIMAPALVSGALTGGIDSIFHARWQNAFASQLWGGEIYPRWLVDLNGGFGSPAFFVYPPLSHYLTALLHPLMPDPRLMVLRLGISAWAAMMLSGFACFFWLRRVLGGNQPAALLGAVSYMLAPYHLYIDVYQRGAFAEVWAFVWPPLTLLAVDGLRTASPRRLAWLSLTIAGLATTHAPSAVIFLPAYLIYALMLDGDWRRPRLLAWTCLGIALGLMLAGFYLGTALTHSAVINAAALFTGRNAATNWLIGGDAWPDPAIARDVGTAYLVQGLLAVLPALWLLIRSDGARSRRLALVALMLAFLPLVLMSEFSRPLWSLGLPINRVQFPWRYMSLLTVAGALSVGLLMARLTKRVSAIAAAAVPLIFLAVNTALYAVPAPLPAGITAAPPRADPVSESWDAPEYRLALPEKVSGVFAEGERVRLVDGAGSVNVTVWRGREIRLTVDVSSRSTIAIRQFGYPGWQVSSGGDAGITLVKGEPYLQIAVPPGRHDIALTLAPMQAERIGDVVSLVAALVIACLLLFGGRRSAAGAST